MPNRFTPIMFRVPGRPGIFNMEEILEYEEACFCHYKDFDKHPMVVIPIVKKNQKYERWGKMQLGTFIEKIGDDLIK